MARMARAPGPALSPWLRRLAFGLLAAYLAIVVFLIWRTALLPPQSDQLDWIMRWRELQAGGDWASYLLAAHNQNRMGWTMALLALDLQAFGGTNLPLIASGVLGLGAMAAMLAREAAQAAPAPLPLPAGVLAAMLVLLAGNLLDASTPINATYVHAAAFAVVAIVLAEGAERPNRILRRLAALLCAIAAGFGSGVGLAVWPVLAIAAWRRREWSWLSLIAAAGGAFVTCYVWNAPPAGGLTAALQSPMRAAHLALNFLALPWSRIAPAHAWVGGLIVATTAATAVLLRGGRYATRSERVACGLILFSLGAAAMAGLGRAGEPGALDVPLRYGLLVSPLHVGLLMLALPYAGVLWRANRGLAHGLCATALVLALVQQAGMAFQAVRVSDHAQAVIEAFQAGRRTPEMLTYVHPDLARAEQVYAGLRRDGLFSGPLHLNRPEPAR